MVRGFTFLLKLEIKYLGIKLSYTSFEFQSMRYRCQQPWSNFSSLRKALRVNGPLSLRERLRIHHTRVWTVLEYGAVGTGVDRRSLHLLESTVAQQLRKVMREYGKGISNQAIFDKAGIDPRHILAQRFEASTGRIAKCAVGSAVHSNLQRATQVEQYFLATAETQRTQLTPVQSDGIPCPNCGVYFDSEAGLALHIQRRHTATHQQAKLSFQRAKHCVDGMPQCAFCMSWMANVQAMEKHIAAGGCLVLKQAAAQGKDPDVLLNEILQERIRVARGAAAAQAVDSEPGTA